MTILNKMLVFNKPQEDIKCGFCNGTGIIKSDRFTGGTQIWSFLVVVITLVALLSITTKPTIINMGFFIVGAILSILTLLEFKQQRKY